jgi:hypothetical protein
VGSELAHYLCICPRTDAHNVSASRSEKLHQDSSNSSARALDHDPVAFGRRPALEHEDRCLRDQAQPGTLLQGQGLGLQRNDIGGHLEVLDQRAGAAGDLGDGQHAAYLGADSEIVRCARPRRDDVAGEVQAGNGRAPEGEEGGEGLDEDDVCRVQGGVCDFDDDVGGRRGGGLLQVGAEDERVCWLAVLGDDPGLHDERCVGIGRRAMLWIDSAVMDGVGDAEKIHAG